MKAIRLPNLLGLTSTRYPSKYPVIFYSVEFCCELKQNLFWTLEKKTFITNLFPL